VGKLAGEQKKSNSCVKKESPSSQHGQAGVPRFPISHTRAKEQRRKGSAQRPMRG
jgi:hypothetical protein